jgi:hypothetical protein
VEIIWKDVPEYRAAYDRQNLARDSAFFLDHEIIAGIRVRPFSARHFTLLETAGSPFLCGGHPDAADVALFLWVVCFIFQPGNKRERDKFVRSCRKVRYSVAVPQIDEYISDAIYDAPGGNTVPFKPGPVSWLATFVDLIAREYHWPEEIILDMPLKRFFQYLRCIRRHYDPDCVFINPITDRAQRLHVQKTMEHS